MERRPIFILFFLFLIIILSGCCPLSPGQDKDIIVSVNNYSITRDEFESEFKISPYGKIDTAESRKDFLNTLIDRKLILQYAQQKSFDKEKSFLKSIEKFWEQSLLKVALDKKTGEIEAKISASDWKTARAEETKMMSDWMNELREKARITVKGDILKANTDYKKRR